MRLRWLLFAFLLLPIQAAEAQCAGATTCAALTCGSTDVQTALNTINQDGTTLTIPSGTCTWTTQVSYTQVGSLSIIGAGSQSTLGGGDATVIIDNLDRSVSDNAGLSLTQLSGKTLRLCCITMEITNSANYTNNGTLRVGGPGITGTCTTPFRLDHFHITNLRKQGVSIYGVCGVADHDLFDMTAGVLDNALRPHGVFSTNGDPEWAANTDYGTNEFFFVENSTFNNAIVSDCLDGGRQVWRYNTFNNSYTQTHPTGSQNGEGRGCRAREIYHNTYNGGACSAGECFNADFTSAGGLLIWANTTGSLFQNFITLHSMRRNNNTYAEVATPNGWGYCGTSFNGTGSGWDQNSVASTGYACIDQPGRGKGDLLSGSFPTRQDNTNPGVYTGTWPNQALEPIYEWQDSWTGSGGGSFAAVYDTPSLSNNVDYYLWCDPSSPSGCTSFNGTVGVGSGTLSSRPATCTIGVGYFATDQGPLGKLYLCGPTNTWTLYYTPYTYPHPLAAIAAASGLGLGTSCTGCTVHRRLE